MSWLTPVWLGLGLLAVIPVWLHLASRPPPAGHQVASVMFLQAQDLRLHHRRDLRDRLLMALRILLLVALGLALAEPVIRAESGTLATPEPPTVLLMDRSASMTIHQRWNAAQALAADAIDEVAAQGGDLAIVSFAAAATVQSDFTKRFGRLRAAVDTLRPVPAHAQLAPALMQAVTLLERHPGMGGRIVLVTDTQRGSVSLTTPIRLPDDIDVMVRVVQTQPVKNLGVAQLQVDDDPRQVRLLIQNSGDQDVRDARLTLRHEQHALLETSVSLAAGATRTVRVPFVDSPDKTTLVHARLSSDDFDYDNERALVLQPRPVMRVRTLNGRRLAVPVTVLLDEARALKFRLPAMSGGKVSRRSADSVAGINERSLLVLDAELVEGRLLAERGVDEAASGVLNAGATVLIWPGSYAARSGATEHADSDPPWWPRALDLYSATRVSGAQGSKSLVGLNAALKTTLWSGFAVAEMDGDQVLGRWQDGRAAIVKRPVGNGQLLVIGMSLAANQHASAGAVALAPLVLGSIAEAANIAGVPGSYRAGALVRAGDSMSSDARSFTLIGPDGEQSPLRTDAALFAPSVPGLYQVYAPGKAHAEGARFWVDFDAGEADLTSGSELDVARGIIREPLSSVTTEGAGIDGFDEPRLQPLWWWFMVLVLVCAALEAALAARSPRPQIS